MQHMSKHFSVEVGCGCSNNQVMLEMYTDRKIPIKWSQQCDYIYGLIISYCTHHNSWEKVGICKAKCVNIMPTHRTTKIIICCPNMLCSFVQGFLCTFSVPDVNSTLSALCPSNFWWDTVSSVLLNKTFASSSDMNSLLSAVVTVSTLPFLCVLKSLHVQITYDTVVTSLWTVCFCASHLHVSNISHWKDVFLHYYTGTDYNPLEKASMPGSPHLCIITLSKALPKYEISSSTSKCTKSKPPQYPSQKLECHVHCHTNNNCVRV